MEPGWYKDQLYGMPTKKFYKNTFHLYMSEIYTPIFNLDSYTAENTQIYHVIGNAGFTQM